MAQGEVLSAKLVTQILRNNGIPAHFTDSRLLIKTDAKFGDAQPLDALSRENILNHFKFYNRGYCAYRNWIYCL